MFMYFLFDAIITMAKKKKNYEFLMKKMKKDIHINFYLTSLTTIICNCNFISILKVMREFIYSIPMHSTVAQWFCSIKKHTADTFAVLCNFIHVEIVNKSTADNDASN